MSDLPLLGLQGVAGLEPGRLRQATVLLAGAGNIGSHLAGLLARAGVRRLYIVDRDYVEAKNVRNQDFLPADIGQPKAEVLARRVQGQAPGVAVQARTANLEDLPLGFFAVDLILGALDSRAGRQALISNRAWPLGVPVVDGGVGEGLLGRVQVFVPGPASACLECGWSREDYRQLAAEYPCAPGMAATAPATLSPAFSGAVVAGLMAAEAVRILAGTAPLESQEIAFDLLHRRFLVSRLRRAASCRFDHAVVRDTVRLGRDFASATVGDLLAAAEGRAGETAFHMELGRTLASGNGLAAERFLTPERWRPRAAERLADLGLLPEDRIRVRTASESFFVVPAA